jgi:hypothetical protein
MHSVIRKVKSLQIFTAKEVKEVKEVRPKERLLTLPELHHQLDLLDELVDLMIKESLTGRP